MSQTTWHQPDDAYWTQGDASETWKIDTDYLQSAVGELQSLQRFIVEQFLPHFKDIHDRAGTQEHHPFGGGRVKSAGKVFAKHSQYLSTARQTYDAIAKQLGDAAAATQDIIANYQKVEQSNAEIEKIFQSHANGGVGSSSTSANSRKYG